MSTTLTSTIAPHFWRTPIRYCRWAAHEKPAIYYSILIGITGPVMLVSAPGIKRYFGINRRSEIPYTYPVPKGSRPTLDGYGDP